MRRGAAPAALLLVALVLLGACSGGGSFAGSSGKDVKSLSAGLVPTLNGLTAKRENVSKALGSAHRSYVDATSLYSFRTGDVLQATLQVSRFSKEATTDKNSVHTQVVGRIGSTVPQAFKVGTDTVYLTTGKRQNISVWFRDRYLFVLAVREEYDQPRTLLRQALDIRP
jgi:hypothetical protein